LADITFQHIALKKETSDEKSTEEREMAIEQLLTDFERYQSNCVYNFEPNQIIINLIKSVNYDVKMENEQYAKSYEIEPRMKKNSSAHILSVSDAPAHQRSESVGGKWEFGKIQIQKPGKLHLKPTKKEKGMSVPTSAIIQENSGVDQLQNDADSEQPKKRERKYFTFRLICKGIIKPI
jgi:hypothetical protein